jgi:hypothetical protein
MPARLAGRLLWGGRAADFGRRTASAEIDWFFRQFKGTIAGKRISFPELPETSRMRRESSNEDATARSGDRSTSAREMHQAETAFERRNHERS